MSVMGAIVVTFILTGIMIGLVVFYLGKGYSYKHTIDELPQEDSAEKKE